eukprot:TRINITY_DN27217_c0_g7_i1.p1 TRINITY_DN27217_c0_g7~~TRINITY_DN27217_c0_g7_i1.p1  ORF type:complete len:474 (-),score=97.18 TRINITY_DN27217_c0_g7_i1:65-1297(-)
MMAALGQAAVQVGMTPMEIRSQLQMRAQGACGGSGMMGQQQGFGGGAHARGKKRSGSAAGFGAVGGGSGFLDAPHDKIWKEELVSAYGKSRKQDLPKTAYQTTELQIGERTMFQSTVTIDGIPYHGESAPGKKAAEQEAAKVAFQALFPDAAFTQRPPPPQGHGGNGSYDGVGRDHPKKSCFAAGFGAVGGGSGFLDAPHDKIWKEELVSAYGKSRKQDLPKTAYQTTELQIGERTMFQSTVTIDGIPYHGESAPGKKAAEQEAAKVAFQALFPDAAFTQRPPPPQGHGGNGSRDDGGRDHPKNRLLNGLTVLYGRALTKQDYTVDYFEVNGKYQARIGFDGKCVYSGEPSDTKKLAEASACEAALEAVKYQIEPAVAQHEAIKKQNNQKKLEALKERVAARKAAQTGMD